MQILNVLEGRSDGWINHPAVKMWRGYEDALKLYHNIMIQEWLNRGYNNTMLMAEVNEVTMPHWLGEDRLHSSHRGNLLTKDPEHYGQFGWTEEPVIGYWWPE